MEIVKAVRLKASMIKVLVHHLHTILCDQRIFAYNDCFLSLLLAQRARGLARVCAAQHGSKDSDGDLHYLIDRSSFTQWVRPPL